MMVAQMRIEAKAMITISQPLSFAPPLLLAVVVFVSALEPVPADDVDVDGVVVVDGDAVVAEAGVEELVAVELPSASVKIFASGESAGRFSKAAQPKQTSLHITLIKLSLIAHKLRVNSPSINHLTCFFRLSQFLLCFV